MLSPFQARVAERSRVPTERKHNGQLAHLSSGVDKQAHPELREHVACYVRVRDADPMDRFDRTIEQALCSSPDRNKEHNHAR
jgi:hypothetical protein